MHQISSNDLVNSGLWVEQKHTSRQGYSEYVSESIGIMKIGSTSSLSVSAIHAHIFSDYRQPELVLGNVHTIDRDKMVRFYWSVSFGLRFNS